MTDSPPDEVVVIVLAQEQESDAATLLTLDFSEPSDLSGSEAIRAKASIEDGELLLTGETDGFYNVLGFGIRYFHPVKVEVVARPPLAEQDTQIGVFVTAYMQESFEEVYLGVTATGYFSLLKWNGNPNERKDWGPTFSTAIDRKTNRNHLMIIANDRSADAYINNRRVMSIPLSEEPDYFAVGLFVVGRHQGFFDNFAISRITEE